MLSARLLYGVTPKLRKLSIFSYSITTQPNNLTNLNKKSESRVDRIPIGMIR